MSNKKIKTIFIGTPDFGIPALQALIHDEMFTVTTVISQPDKKIGRYQILTAAPIKKIALENNIPVIQPISIKAEEKIIKEIKPDLIIVVAYAQIIPGSILSLPKYGCVNVHASLLPYCRGAACVQQPILDGKKESGITIMQMDEGLDTGPIIAQFKTKIENHDTAGSKFEKLSRLGGEALVPTLKKYVAGKLEPTKQDNEKATYVGMLSRDNGRIDFKKSAQENERFVRAMSPWPGAFSEFEGQSAEPGTASSALAHKKLKILKVAHETLKINNYRIGEIFCFEKKLSLQCGKDALIVEELQLEGKKPQSSSDFLNGHGDAVGKIFKQACQPSTFKNPEKAIKTKIGK